jgi:dTDP-4-dehydrorhamnose reductase
LGAHPLDCDISESHEVEEALDAARPLVVINCAAYTAVDDAESPVNHERAMRANMTGPGILRSMFDGYLIHMSTGFVFDGSKGPYSEEDEPSPVNFYGMTKLGGEAALSIRPRYPSVIVRVLDLFGPGPSPDFVSAVRGVLESGGSKALPANLFGTPTYIPHLAEALVAIIERGHTGTLHIGGTANLSRYKWGRMIAEHFGFDPEQIKHTERITGLAPRPLNATLDVSKARSLGLPLYDPKEGLEALAESEAANDPLP